MHSSVYVFIPLIGDLEIEVARALSPFDEGKMVTPYKVYLSSREIEAMAARHDSKPNEFTKLARLMPRWRGQPGGVDHRGLYSVSTFNPQCRWDWYEVGGRWDGILANNVVEARALLARPDLSAILPAQFIDRNGLWHEQEQDVANAWSPGEFIARSEQAWLDEFRAALKAAPDSRVACVDIHS